MSSSRSLWHRNGSRISRTPIKLAWPTPARRLEKLTKQFVGPVECESLVESGRPADSIASIADERRAGVIVMGLASSQGPLGSRPGSIAYRVLCLAKAPVLVVPPQSLTESHKNEPSHRTTNALRDLAGPTRRTSPEQLKAILKQQTDLYRALSSWAEVICVALAVGLDCLVAWSIRAQTSRRLGSPRVRRLAVLNNWLLFPILILASIGLLIY